MNNNNGLDNITKYLLNYLFKKIDDLTAENQSLKLKIGMKAAEDEFLNNVAKEAMKMAKDLGLLEEEKEESNNQSMDSFIKKKKNEA